MNVLKSLKTALTVSLAVMAGLVPVMGQDMAALRRRAAVSVPPPSVTLRAIMVSNDNWGAGAADAGVYTIDVRPGGAVTCLHRSEAMADVAAAIVRGQTMYAVEASTSGFFYRSYSTATWATIGSRQEIDVVNVPSDLTYDAVTGKVYGGFWDEDEGEFSRFCSFSLSTAEASDIKGQHDIRDIFAIAATPDGVIYGLFGAYDYLAVLDPKKGTIERVGLTGLSPDANLFTGKVNSMCYDSANGRLLATVCQSTGYGASKKMWSGLYEIDPATGKATEIMLFDGNAAFAGLEVYSDRPSATAPVAPQGVKVTPDADGDEGTLEFDIPATTVGGAPLAGDIMAIVDVNGGQTVYEGFAPGQHVNLPSIPLVQGNNTVKVSLATATERGEAVQITFRVGDDAPLPVTGVTLNVVNGKAQLSWTPAPTGVNGGAVDASRLRYRIVRYPDQTLLANDYAGTAFDDATADPSWKALYYTVAAYNGQGEAAPVASNKCPAAGAMPVPFAEGFDTADDFDTWTVVDLNGSVTWQYDKSTKSAMYKYPLDATPGDDWLISPPVAVTAGSTYKLSYQYRAYNKRYPERLEVAVAFASGTEAMNVLASHLDFVHTALEDGAVSFKAEADGVAFIGFHCISEPKMWSLYVDNVLVEQLDSRVPAPVADLCAIAADKGGLKARITFTAPDSDTEGSHLAGLAAVTVRRAGKEEPVAVVSPVAPGQSVCIDDELPADGTYVYSVTATNGVGESVAATATVYVGVDAPGSPAGLALADDAGAPVLTWQAPEKGLNGGWYDPDAITYRIIRSDGIVVAEAVADTRYVDSSYKKPVNGQDAVYYVVTSWCGKLHGGYAQSEPELFGDPYQAPCSEGFPSADMDLYPWLAQSSTAAFASWTLDNMGYNPSCADHNGDRGLATFHSVGEAPGTISWFYSPKVSLAGVDNPAVTFAMYHSPSLPGDAALEVYVSADGGAFMPAEGAVFARTDGDADGWQRHTVDLSGYRAGIVRVAFRGAGDGVADIYLDNVCFDSSAEIDLAVESLAAPSRIAAGETVAVAVTVANTGTTAAAGTLTVNDGSAIAATAAVPLLAPGQESRISLDIAVSGTGTHTITAIVTADGDRVEANNSATAFIQAVGPVIPRPTGLEVSASDDNAVLTWTAPGETPAITDTFESYPDWAIDGVGEWTMFDGDYDMTYYINKDAGQYENATARKAFQVLNMNRLGVDIWDEGLAFSGDKLMAAMASVNYVNNDWLISPRLNGTAQWITFYARCFTTQNTPAERMMVYTGSADTDPANFTAISSQYIELDGNWRQFRYFMPAGTRHFAIVCVSDGAFAMFVDDAAFNDLTVPAWEVTGYEVWRDGAKIAQTDDTSFVDTDAPAKAQYTVRALYGDKGVSGHSDSAEWQSSALSDVSASRTVDYIVTVQGIAVDTAAPLTPGVYVVHYTDGSTAKIAVK